MRGLALLLLAIALCAFFLVRFHRGGSGDSGAALMVYCAASLKKPVEEAALAFERETGTRVQLQFGGSGTLLSQIRVTARGDLLLTADEGTIDDARKSGTVGEVARLAVQVPIIAVARGNPKAIRVLDDLLRDDVRVALANPEAASIGKTSRAAFGERWERLAGRATVMKPTVTEIATDLSLGAVDAAIIWDTLLRQFSAIEAVHVPELDSRPEHACAAVLAASIQSERARAFMRFLTQDDRGGAVFRKHGFKAAAAP